MVNGNTAVLVEAKGSFNQRLDLYAEQTEIIVEKFEKTLPEEFSIDLVYDESFYIKERFQQLTRSIGTANYFGFVAKLLSFRLKVGNFSQCNPSTNYFYSAICLPTY